jgi:hypothetical protein
LLWGVSSTFAQEYEDVVYLKSGDVRRGIIIEEIPNVSIKIKTRDGNIFVYSIEDIERKTKEQSPNYRPIQHQNNLTAKSPGVAFTLSFVPGIIGLTGGGQFYNGQTGQGVAHLATGIVSLLVFVAESENRQSWERASFMEQFSAWAYLGNWIVSSIDAARSASRMNKALAHDSKRQTSKLSLSFVSTPHVTLGLRSTVTF